MTADARPDPDDPDARLLDAAAVGDDRSVIAALDAGAEIDHQNEFGFNALRSALWGAHLATARLLVKRGATVGVDEAAALGDVGLLETTWPSDPSAAEAIGAYLLACRAGQVASIAWFLDHGMPVDLHPSGEEWGGVGCPGLHHAAGNGRLGAVRLLLDAGADPLLVDDVYGGNALDWAESGGDAHVVSLLADRTS